jgi:nitric oxide reductase subunit C
MSEILTKSRARNIFYGGSLFFVVIFGVLAAQSHRYVVTTSTAGMPLSEAVILGKHVWERHSCINCHTLHGEGAYFAPELGNVMTRWDTLKDPEGAFEILDGWMQAQPSGIEGRRQMPRFDITEQEMRGLAEFLRWADQTDTQGWPPTDAG